VNDRSLRFRICAIAIAQKRHKAVPKRESDALGRKLNRKRVIRVRDGASHVPGRFARMVHKCVQCPSSRQTRFYMRFERASHFDKHNSGLGTASALFPGTRPIFVSK
jgi:hypothetical protein